MISIHNLSVTLGGTPILEDISTGIGAGQVTALVGPNGAGKSTLLAALGRLIAPSAGEIRFEDRPLADWPNAELARRLAVLRQDTQIATRLSVADLVAFGRYPHSQGRLNATDHAKVAQCLDRLELTDLAGRFLDTLSGGQRQRALIAMTLAQETDALLLDEPLNNLDLTHARQVMRIARDEADAGRAVVIVLHDLTIAARFADRIVALKSGRIALDGPPAEVVTGPALSALYGTPVEVVSIAGRPVVLPI